MPKLRLLRLVGEIPKSFSCTVEILFSVLFVPPEKYEQSFSKEFYPEYPVNFFEFAGILYAVKILWKQSVSGPGKTCKRKNTGDKQTQEECNQELLACTVWYVVET